MSLRRAVAAPFRARGVDEMQESEFVVALSLDRGWFTPDQAKRLLGVAGRDGLVARDGETVTPTFEPEEVAIPDRFEPDESLLEDASTFERVLEDLVEAGVEKQEAVAECNRLQAELAVTLEAAAVLFARRKGLDASPLARRARAEL